ncbi:MAG: HEPN domain-containing protein [bacterium]
MADVRLSREWFDKAEEDFEFARLNHEEGKPFFSQICFHFQQAAEKLLKAYVVAHELEFRKIHDLTVLLKICASKDSSLERLADDCEFLNAYYVESRYPVHWPTHFTREETCKAYAAAARIRSEIKARLSLLP